MASRVVAVFSSGWQLTSTNGMSARIDHRGHASVAIVDQGKWRDRTWRHAEQFGEQLGIAEAQPPELEVRCQELEIDASIVLGDHKSCAPFLVGQEQILGMSARQTLAQRLRLLDGEHRLVLHRSRGDAEFGKAFEQSLSIRGHQAKVHAHRLDEVLDPREILMPSRPVARPMDNGGAINYKAQQCLQAQTGWCWQERESRPDRGCSSGVEHNLAKVGVVGSNPIARSNTINHIAIVSDLSRREWCAYGPFPVREAFMPGPLKSRRADAAFDGSTFQKCCSVGDGTTLDPKSRRAGQAISVALHCGGGP